MIRDSRISYEAMALKPQDIVVLVYLAQLEGPWTYPSVAAALGMSASEVHGSIRRSTAAGLFDHRERLPIRENLLEFLVHGLKYVFPVERGGITRGVPTAHAVAPLNKKLVSSRNDPIPVWPDAHGATRGESWQPLYRSVPAAARHDPHLHEWLALLDAIRGGRPRDRSVAVAELSRRLG